MTVIWQRRWVGPLWRFLVRVFWRREWKKARFEPSRKCRQKRQRRCSWLQSYPRFCLPVTGKRRKTIDSKVDIQIVRVQSHEVVQPITSRLLKWLAHRIPRPLFTVKYSCAFQGKNLLYWFILRYLFLLWLRQPISNCVHVLLLRTSKYLRILRLLLTKQCIPITFHIKR